MGWARLWDGVVDLGPKHIKGLQALSRILSCHGRGNKPCPLCDVMDLEGVLLDHVLERHVQQLGMCTDSVMNKLKVADLNFLCMFHNIYVL